MAFFKNIFFTILLRLKRSLLKQKGFYSCDHSFFVSLSLWRIRWIYGRGECLRTRVVISIPCANLAKNSFEDSQLVTHHSSTRITSRHAEAVKKKKKFNRTTRAHIQNTGNNRLPIHHSKANQRRTTYSPSQKICAVTQHQCCMFFQGPSLSPDFHVYNQQ